MTSLMKKIQSVRGMNDILPKEISGFQYLEKTFADLLRSYGYQEIRTPIIESTDLFKRSIGEITDIVEKEMYTFVDKNQDSLSLRPEGTASIVRAIIQNGLLQTKQKLWYQGAMFRHERPQKGRYRQFHQLGCEVFGFKEPEIDAEMIAMTHRLWNILGIKNIELQINSLGSFESRNNYRTVLIDYFKQYKNILDNDSLRRLDSNPLRILDSKNQNMQNIINNAPKLIDYLDQESKQHFIKLTDLLTALNIPFIINHHLVRGLDYYNKTVFEWVSQELGAQGTICAGGRYDSLVEQIGGVNTPAVGFAIGMERILSLLHNHPSNKVPDIYMILQGEEAQKQGLMLAEKLHQNHLSLIILTNCDAGSFKTQFKRADKSNAKFAFVIGEDEINNNQISIKNLIQKTEQKIIDTNMVDTWIVDNISK